MELSGESRMKEMNSFSDIFELMKERLNITETAKKLFLDPIKPIKLNNKTAVLYISNDWAKKIIRETSLKKYSVLKLK